MKWVLHLYLSVFCLAIIPSLADILSPLGDQVPRRCLQPIDPGPCTDHLIRYAYDKDVGYCTQFVYSGCDGNTNRFDTLKQCKHLCENSGAGNKTGDYEGYAVVFFRLQRRSTLQ